MTASLTDILRKTLAVIEAHEEFRQDSPAILQLRRDMARALGDLEVAKAARLSGTSTPLRASESLKKIEPV